MGWCLMWGIFSFVHNDFRFWSCRQSSMDGRCGLTRQSSGWWRSLRDGDFEEEDVWDVLRERKDSNVPISDWKSIESSACFPRIFPTAARMIPRVNFNNDSGSGSSSSSTFSHEGKVMQQSAPVNVPDWSKISGKTAEKISRNVNSRLDDDGDRDDDDDDADGQVVVNGSGNSDEDGVGDDVDDDDIEYNSKVPPHEFIARRLARSQISSFSVFEGVGRTLKGRDLSRVRNAILTKTGFLELP